ncbi:MAG: class I SAM-dependent methyltransferase [Anaerolineaceae bacterium]|nr:class I SAM-dependent methyltransferase [Anaerolineaceae bacterium]
MAVNIFRWLAFNLWYFRRPPWDTRVSPPELLEFIAAHPPGRALDLGCGTGTNVITLAKAGWQATGVDFAVRAISQARQKIEREKLNADVLVGDVSELKGISGPFDLVLDIGCYHGIPLASRAAYRRNLQRVLAPGCFFMLYGAVAGRSADISISAEEIAEFSRLFDLIQREDGEDTGGKWHSAWFWFQNTVVKPKSR